MRRWALWLMLPGLLAVARLVPRPEPPPLAPEIAPSADTLPDPAPPLSDSFDDGTPDFLRLASAADRRAFTGWLTALAEAQFLRSPSEVPREIKDCAALLRFCYREALAPHDGRWAAAAGLSRPPALPDVEQYRYPRTPLGANLFRVAPGRFRPADLSNGSFAAFADARTLFRRNTHLVSRATAQAEPGDLLFFDQPGQDMPFHAMLYLGPSSAGHGPGPFVVYHTGPLDGTAGEIRRPSLSELAAHPEPRWRPLTANPSFLGVYRWNILRRDR